MDMYLTAKALHIISFICWMAGLLYLPRLYVYHAGVEVGSEMDTTFQTMERKLLRYIMNPAMLATWAFGIWLIVITGAGAPDAGKWIHAKLGLVLLLSASHGMMAAQRKRFARGENTKTSCFYRFFNEVPTLLMIGIVFLAVLKPF